MTLLFLSDLGPRTTETKPRNAARRQSLFRPAAVGKVCPPIDDYRPIIMCLGLALMHAADLFDLYWVELM
jgi:hypothetical protein